MMKWQNIPFSPKRFPFFYGWVIVAACTIGIFASLPGQTMGVGVFTDSLVEKLGLTRTQLSTAYMIGTLISSMILPFAGKMLDRWGARVMVVISSIGLGFGLAGLSQCDRILHNTVGQNIMLVMAGMSLFFLVIRFFGQGCLTMVSRVSMGKWFNHRRGLAVAISGIFVSFGFNGAPYILNRLLEGQGWRMAALILAVTVGIGMTIIGWLFYRDNPEQCDLVMDGVTDEAWLARKAAKIPDTHREFTRAEAAKTWAFWAFSLGLALHAFIATAIAFHIASLGGEMGLDRESAYQVFIPMSFFSIASNFISSWLSDRVRMKYLLAVMMAFQFVGIFGLYMFDSSMGRFLFIFGQGIAGGLFATLSTVVLPRYFGREHLGAISGLNISVIVIASAVGPVTFSKGHDITGSYSEILILSLSLPIILFISSFRANNPQRQIIESE